MAQLGTYLGALAILSLDRLQLGAYSYAPIIVSVSKKLTQLCSQGLDDSLSLRSRRLVLGMGAVKKNFIVQVTFCLLRYFGITIDRPNFGTVNLPSLLDDDNSGVLITLARIVPVFVGVHTELRDKGPPSFFHSDSSVEVPALAKPNYVIVYFAPLQLSMSHPQPNQTSVMLHQMGCDHTGHRTCE